MRSYAWKRIVASVILGLSVIAVPWGARAIVREDPAGPEPVSQQETTAQPPDHPTPG